MLSSAEAAAHQPLHTLHAAASGVTSSRCHTHFFTLPAGGDGEEGQVRDFAVFRASRPPSPSPQLGQAEQPPAAASSPTARPGTGGGSGAGAGAGGAALASGSDSGGSSSGAVGSLLVIISRHWLAILVACVCLAAVVPLLGCAMVFVARRRAQGASRQPPARPSAVAPTQSRGWGAWQRGRAASYKVMPCCQGSPLVRTGDRAGGGLRTWAALSVSTQPGQRNGPLLPGRQAPGAGMLLALSHDLAKPLLCRLPKARPLLELGLRISPALHASRVEASSPLLLLTLTTAQPAGWHQIHLRRHHLVVRGCPTQPAASRRQGGSHLLALHFPAASP
jgi:hypothetical protein